MAHEPEDTAQLFLQASKATALLAAAAPPRAGQTGDHSSMTTDIACPCCDYDSHLALYRVEGTDDRILACRLCGASWAPDQEPSLATAVDVTTRLSQYVTTFKYRDGGWYLMEKIPSGGGAPAPG